MNETTFPIKERMLSWFFVQGDEADTYLRLLDEKGEEALINYIMNVVPWHYDECDYTDHIYWDDADYSRRYVLWGTDSVTHSFTFGEGWQASL